MRFPSRESHQIPQSSTYCLIWKQQQKLIIWTLHASCSIKSINNYSNNKPHDPNGFKEEVKIKYDVIKVVARSILNGIAVMMSLFEAEAVPSTWVDYCVMPPADRLVLEESGDGLNRAMLYLMN